MVFLFLLLTISIALFYDFIKSRRSSNEYLYKSYTTTFSEKDPAILADLHVE